MVGIALYAHEKLFVVIHRTYAATQIQRQGTSQAVVAMEVVISIAYIRGQSDVQQPLATQHPIVGISHKQAIVVVEDAWRFGLGGDVNTCFVAQFLYIKLHVEVLQAEACKP